MGRAGPRYEVGARHVLLLVVDDARAVAVVDDARAVAVVVVSGPHPCMGHSRHRSTVISKSSRDQCCYH